MRSTYNIIYHFTEVLFNLKDFKSLILIKTQTMSIFQCFNVNAKTVINLNGTFELYSNIFDLRILLLMIF